MVFFDAVSLAPPDPIFGLAAAFNTDPRPFKINLSVGMYKTPDLNTPILTSVKKAESAILATEKNKEYLPIDGDKNYLDEVGALIFGPALWREFFEQISSVQGIGGTGALRLGADFLKQEVSDHLYYSHPTWANHLQVMSKVGMKIASYPYYDVKKHCLEFDKMVAFLQNLPPKSIVLLHAACHNPTGADPSLDQWRELSRLFFDKKLVPFFDFAYQGFGDGLDADAASIRLFLEAGHEMLVANSFSKNFGLYGERVGALFIATPSKKNAEHVTSQLKILVRTNYSNPPIHGEQIVSHILSDTLLRKEWELELAAMRERITEMKEALTSALVSRSKKRDFRFLKERKGLFCFCGLEKKEVDRLISEFGIYMTGDGRINVVGLNDDNLDYVVNAILQVVEHETH